MIPTVKPTLGRIVHYVNEHNEHAAAIVTQVPGKDGIRADEVILTVFWPEEMANGILARHDSEGKIAGSWHWPERNAEENGA